MAQQQGILVANASQARLFERASFSGPLLEPVSYTHLTLPTICSV